MIQKRSVPLLKDIYSTTVALPLEKIQSQRD